MASELVWINASNPNGSCVDVAWEPATGGVLVRDSKDPEGPQLHYTPEEWNAFLAGVERRMFTLAALEEAATAGVR